MRRPRVGAIDRSRRCACDPMGSGRTTCLRRSICRAANCRGSRRSSGARRTASARIPRLEPSLAAGRRSEMVLGIDIAPTILSLSGIKPPDAMQGQDLIPIVRGTSNAWRSHFYYQHTYNPESERGTIAESEGIRTKQWKYIRYPKTQPLFEQLFDLKNDPKELVNLAMQSDQSSILNVLRLLCDQKAEE